MIIPVFLWEKELPIGHFTVGEVIENNPELQNTQVLNTKAKEDRTWLGWRSRFSDWKSAVKAIACLKHCVKQIKGLRPKTNKTVEKREETGLFLKLIKAEASVVKSKV